MPSVVLSIGSNLGDRIAALQSVVDAMSVGFDELEVSRVFETPPWGYVDQPPFLNAAIRAQTQLSPAEVLSFAQACEGAAERVRNERWGPRTLDVDVILYDDLEQSNPELVLPHPRAHERAFVLVCMADIDPTMRIPGRGNVMSLLHHVDVAGIEPVGSLEVSA